MDGGEIQWEYHTNNFKKKINNLSKYTNSKNIVNKRNFKNKNGLNPSFKAIYLIKNLLFYKDISISKLIDSILKLIITSTV